MVSTMSSFDSNNKIMIANIPYTGILTLYSMIGDIIAYLSVGFTFVFLIWLRRLDRIQ